MKLGEPLPVREHQIRELQASAPGRTWPFEFKGRTDSYPVYQVSLGFPKYRLNNGRTLAAQEEWLTNHPGSDPQLFSRDQELDLAQKAQHEILESMVDDENLLKYFRDNPQKEPLILSNKGFLINGNRRLCAFRKLYEESSTEYRRFAQVDVIILPPASDKDIYELEVNLQVLPDLKAEFNWLREAKMMKRGRELFGYTDEDLARIHQCKPKDVRDKIQLLEYADAYLADRGKERQYHLIEKTEFAFKKLRDGKIELNREPDKTVFERLSYLLLDNPGGKGRLYDAIPAVKDNLPKIVERIKKEFPIEHNVPLSPGGDLDLLGVEEDSIALVRTVRLPANRERLLDVMQDVLQSERIRALEFRTANFSVKRVQEAHTALIEALTNLNGGTNTDGLSNQLDSIESTVGKIRQWLRTNAEGTIPN